MNLLICGSTGMVGSSLFRLFSESGYKLIGCSSKEIDLRNKDLTFDFFEKVRPEIVINAAARVGGILANSNYPVEFLFENLAMQNNILEASHLCEVKRVIFLGSSCIYPRMSPQPIKEEYLMTGALEKTNSAYAIAKIAGVEGIYSYRKQYKKSWVSIMPSNVYGIHDNFSAENGHVIPALIRRFDLAQEVGLNQVTLFGSGINLREFIFVDDLSNAINIILDKYDEDSPINVGSGEEISIKKLADLIADKIGFSGEIKWGLSELDGTPRKLLDSSKVRSLGWKPKVTLEDGIDQVIEWYKKSKKGGVLRI